MSDTIEAVVFDCYGTLIDFGDASFAGAYGQICEEQGIAIEGPVFFEKWMEVWRRLAAGGNASDGGSVGVVTGAAALLNQPGPLSEAEPVPPHPAHHTPSAGRSRALDGPITSFRPYSEEWPEQFALCFEEFGVQGDAARAHERLVEMLCQAPAFPESQRVVEAIAGRLPVAVLSNADDDFLLPVLSHNQLEFPLIISSQSAQAYKPHVAIFNGLVEAMRLPHSRILYVGDSRLADIAGAKNAGLQAAWVNRATARNRSIEGRARPSRPQVEPDYEIDSLEGLLPILGLKSG